MAGRPTANEINTQKHVRFWVQPEGAAPDNAVKFSGLDNSYINVETFTNPVRGGTTPIRVHDPQRAGVYRNVAEQVDPPDFASGTVQFLQKRNYLPRHLTTLPQCKATFYMTVGECKDLSDFDGWDSYVKIAADGRVNDKTEAGGAWASDDQLQDELNYTFAGGVYNVGALVFGEQGASEVYSEVIDIVYGSNYRCGANCGPDDDGTETIYALMEANVASVGEAPKVVYSIDGGTTWTEQAITGAASTDSPKAIAVVGDYLVVVFDDAGAGGYFYTTIDNITGVPTSTWTKVTTGFVSGSAPQAIYVATPREVWLAGDSGYLYKSTNIPAGVTAEDAGNTTTDDLFAIHGLDETIVAGGANGTVVFSSNRGDSFATIDNNPGAAQINTIFVVADFLWWAGDAAGAVNYTRTQGKTAWVAVTLSGTVSTVQDIVFPTPEVGYILTADGDPTATLHTTLNGGYTWGASSLTTTQRIKSWPVLDRGNAIAYPEVSDPNIAANFVVVGGLAGDGSDGIILNGSPAIL